MNEILPFIFFMLAAISLLIKWYCFDGDNDDDPHDDWII